MKIRTTILTAGLMVLISSFTASSLPENYVLVGKNKSVSLYERWITSNSGGKVREIKAIFIVHADMNKAIGFMRDASSGAKWNTNVKTYEILPTDEQNTWFTYIRYRLPWPMEDRDCCLTNTVRYCTDKAQSTEILFQSTTHTKFPERKKVSRINGTTGKWVFTPMDKGQLQVTYLVITTQSSNIPKWIADPIVRDNLIETMTSLKNKLEVKI
jgi:hypothetical protein